MAADHPRLGGWSEVADDEGLRRRLPHLSQWATDHLDLLIDLEASGLMAARGESLVHLDLYAHNILLTRDRVYFVDWPHARRAAPFLDLLTVLSTANGTAVGRDRITRTHPLTANLEPQVIDGVLAAHGRILRHRRAHRRSRRPASGPNANMHTTPSPGSGSASKRRTADHCSHRRRGRYPLSLRQG